VDDAVVDVVPPPVSADVDVVDDAVVDVVPPPVSADVDVVDDVVVDADVVPPPVSADVDVVDEVVLDVVGLVVEVVLVGEVLPAVDTVPVPPVVTVDVMEIVTTGAVAPRLDNPDRLVAPASELELVVVEVLELLVEAAVFVAVDTADAIAAVTAGCTTGTGSVKSTTLPAAVTPLRKLLLALVNVIAPVPACRFAVPTTVSGPFCVIPMLFTARSPVMLLVPSVSRPALVTDVSPPVSDSVPVMLLAGLVMLIAPAPALRVNVVPPGSLTAPSNVTLPLPVLMMLLLPRVNPPVMVKLPPDVS